VTEPDVVIFVCVTCRDEGAADHPGLALYQAVQALLDERADPGLVVRRVECLSVCKRPCTIALAGARRWTYVIGDLNAPDHAADIVDMAGIYRATSDGVTPWRRRPIAFRRGVISRAPPLRFSADDRDEAD
jgi:predicted metal-binding protein